MIRKEIYSKITELLTGSGIQYIGLYNDNGEDLSDSIGYSFPAVFIEFGNITYTCTNGRSKADIRFRLHILNHAELSDNASDNIEAFTIPDNVVTLIEWKESEHTGTWIHTSSISDHSHDDYRHDIEEFRCVGGS